MKSSSEQSELFRENIRLEKENNRLEKENFRLDCLLDCHSKERSRVVAIYLRPAQQRAYALQRTPIAIRRS